MDNTIKYYNCNADSFIRDTMSVDMVELYTPFLSLLPDSAVILDAGSGSGRDFLYFKSKGYQVTAFDASEELVSQSSLLIGQRVLHLSFEEIAFKEEFDGVWACASLLHVPRSKITLIMDKLCQAIKLGGVLYASFKYGDKAEVRNGRFFNDYTEESFQQMISELPKLKIIKLWNSGDLREGRAKEHWLNVLLRKV